MPPLLKSRAIVYFAEVVGDPYGHALDVFLGVEVVFELAEGGAAVEVVAQIQYLTIFRLQLILILVLDPRALLVADHAELTRLRYYEAQHHYQGGQAEEAAGFICIVPLLPPEGQGHVKTPKGYHILNRRDNFPGSRLPVRVCLLLVCGGQCLEIDGVGCGTVAVLRDGLLFDEVRQPRRLLIRAPSGIEFVDILRIHFLHKYDLYL